MSIDLPGRPVDLPLTANEVNLVPAGPRRAYVSFLTAEPRPAWFRTDDGGRNWTGLDLPTTHAYLGVTTAGDLLMDVNTRTGREVRTSTDGGATFDGPMAVEVPAPSSGETVHGMAVTSGVDGVLRVNDGTGWYAIRPPK